MNVTLSSPLRPEEAQAAIAESIEPFGPRSMLRSAFGGSVVTGWISNDRFALSGNFSVGRSGGARLEGGIYLPPGGGTLLLGRLQGLQPVGIFVAAYLLFSGVFIFFFGWGALDPSISTPPMPRWLFLVPIGLDAFAFVVVELIYAGRQRQWEAMQQWLFETAQFTANQSPGPYGPH